MLHRLAALAALTTLVGCSALSAPETTEDRDRSAATDEQSIQGERQTGLDDDGIQIQGRCEGEAGQSLYCGIDCPCDEGEGDCDSDEECALGLVCAYDVGAYYGWGKDVDVCQPACSRNGDSDYDCTPGCPCDEGEGDCDSDEDCASGLWCMFDVGVTYGYDNASVDICVAGCPDVGMGAGNFCTPACPCYVGEGDCDEDIDCEPGLLCARDVGVRYGWNSDVDVCEPINTDPQVDILFPPPAAFTTADTITVRGTAFDWDGLASVRVNGVPVQSSDGLTSWEATVPLTQGANLLTIDVDDQEGNQSTAVGQVTVQMAPAMLHDPRAMAWDATQDRAVVVANTINALLTVDGATGDIGLIGQYESGESSIQRALAWDDAGDRGLLLEAGVLYAVDAATGTRTLISGQARGTGPSLANAQAVAWDEARQRALVAKRFPGSVVAVDPATGNRTTLSGSGTALVYPLAIAVDAAADRIYLADSKRVIAVDLATGQRTLLFTATSTTNPPVADIGSLAWDAAAGRILILDSVQASLFAIDAATGAHTVISSAVQGTGPALVWPQAVVWDPAGERILVTDLQRDALFAVDPATGNRTIVAELAVGTGDKLGSPESLAWDPDSERILVGDVAGNHLVGVDPSTGDRRILTGNTSPAVYPAAVQWDPTNRRALVLDTTMRSLLGIDVITGLRSLISGSGVGAGVPLYYPRSLAWSPLLNAAVILDQTLRAVVSIDVTTGARAIVTNALRGKGPRLLVPVAQTWDEDRDRLLVADAYYPAVLGVEVTTGNRIILSSSDIGTGPALQTPHAMTWDRVGHRALLLDGIPGRLLGLDLNSGNRTVLVDFTTGRGPMLTAPAAIMQLPSIPRTMVADRVLGLLAAVDEVSGQWVILSK